MAADPHHSARSAQSPGQQAAMQQQMQELARKLLDLWQDHLSALAHDPALTAQALKLMTACTPFPWPPGSQAGAAPTGGPGFAPGFFPAGFPSFFPFGALGGAPTGFTPPGGVPTGTATAAPAPDAGAGAVGELRRRLAELEGRLAELERKGSDGAAKPARKPRPRARKPRRGTRKGR